MSLKTRFYTWTAVSSFFSSIERVFSTHSMFSAHHASQVKNVSDNLLTYNYITKDMVGQLGGLYAISKIGKKIDTVPKKMLPVVLACQQTSLMLECATPLIGIDNFLPVAGIASAGTTVSFAGLGAINTICLQKLAKQDIGKLYTEMTVLNTVSSSAGMIAGLWIVSKIPDHETRFCILPFISILRLTCFYKSLKVLGI